MTVDILLSTINFYYKDYKMSILNIVTGLAGTSSVLPSIAYISTSDTEAQVLASGYLNQAVQSGLAAFTLPCMACVSTVASAGANPDVGWYEVSYTASGNPVSVTWSLVPTVAPGNVTLPTVTGDFAVFSNVDGGLKDSSFSPSNAAKTKVVMANAATMVGQFPMFTDVNGTIGDSGVLASSFQPLVASVTFNTAQMVTAYDTPLTIIANPLSSQMILVLNAAVYTASTGNTAYTTGTAPIIQYSTGGTNGAHGLGTIATAAGLAAGDITAATSQVRNLFGLATAALTGLSGKGIYFSNATGDYTAGTGTSVTFTISYLVLTATV